MKTLYVNQEEMFSVEYDEVTDSHFIDVVAGGAGLYTVRVRLSEQEIHEFDAKAPSLVDLADRIRKWPDRFEERSRRL
jgi:hypothetical protein